MSKPTGFFVVDASDDGAIEQPLCLVKHDYMPDGGVLVYPGVSIWGERPSKIRAVFPTRASARAAIKRTTYFRAAYGYCGLPERAFCKIVPVIAL